MIHLVMKWYYKNVFYWSQKFLNISGMNPKLVEFFDLAPNKKIIGSNRIKITGIKNMNLMYLIQPNLKATDKL